MLKMEAKDLPVVTWNETEAPPVGSWLAPPGCSRTPWRLACSASAPARFLPLGVLGVRLDRRESGQDRRSHGRERCREGRPAGRGRDRQGQRQGNHGRKELVETIKAFSLARKWSCVKRDTEELTIYATLGSLSQLVHGAPGRVPEQPGRRPLRAAGRFSVGYPARFDSRPGRVRRSDRRSGRQSGRHQHRPGRPRRKLCPAGRRGSRVGEEAARDAPDVHRRDPTPER